MRWVYATLAAFIAGAALFWPRLLLIVDEDRYVSQALAFAQGRLTIAGSGVLYPPVSVGMISDYPPGTSLLQTPFVWLGGWRLAALASVIALIVATLATVRWLRANGGDAGFAMLVPGFLGAAFFGRIAMSDLPATAIVAVSGLLIWRADRGIMPSMLAGASAGLVLLFREPVVILLAPLLVGAMVRRRCVSWAIVAGFVAAAALRFAANDALFGTPWYVRDPGHGFSVSSLAHTLPLYTLVLGILIPGGLLLPFFYRGQRRGELVAAIAAYVGMFLLYEYDSVHQNGPTKGLVLAARFMAPAMPLFALQAADVWPRWHASLDRRVRLSKGMLTALAGSAAAAVAFSVHPLARRQEAATLPISTAMLSRTRAAAPVITNTDATLKYLSPAYGPRRLIVLRELPADSLGPFMRRFGAMTIVLLDRTDSRAFSAERQSHDRFLAQAAERCALRSTYDEDVARTRLRIYEVSACR